MSGVIEGAHEYMWAAYGIVWAGLVVYGGTLLMRYRSAVADQPPPTPSGDGEEGEPS